MSLHTSTELILTDPEQLKAMGDATRARILTHLEAAPASAKQLADTLEMTHGKVGHHLKVLEDAGLVAVVEERRVRALTERLYGLTYGRLRYAVPGGNRFNFALSQAQLEAATEQPFEPPAYLVTARMSRSRAAEFHRRLATLVEEFGGDGDQDGCSVFGIVAGVFAGAAKP